MMNKKAAERYISPVMFLIWGLIAVAIIAGVWVHYSAKADVRAEEAEFLANRVADCVVDEGYLDEKILGDFDVFQECGLNEEIIDKSGNFYLSIDILDFGTGESILEKPIEKGARDFKIQCELESEHFAECSEKKVYALDRENKKYLIEIIAGSSQLGGKL